MTSRRIIALAACVLAFAVSSARAENGAKGQKPKPELIASTGLFLGRLVEIDEKYRFIYVSPLNGRGYRHTFYLDPRTLYREQRKPTKREEMRPGRRVGVRYVREDDLAYAEAVFLIVGEVNPRDLQMPKKKRKKPEGGEAEKEKKEGGGGGHGGGAPKKPSGGH